MEKKKADDTDFLFPASYLTVVTLALLCLPPPLLPYFYQSSAILAPCEFSSL